jgi:Uma2 family endonuclease
MGTPTLPKDEFDMPVIPPGEPIWQLARLYQRQGEWTEDDYYALNAKFLIELCDGCLEFPPIPTIAHQLIVLYLAKLLDAFVTARKLGVVIFAPVPVHLGLDHVREPDIFFLRSGHPRHRQDYPEGADLVVEVVSGGAGDRERDLVVKPKVYAEAGIPEYWIVDLQEGRITVLALDCKAYREHGVFIPGQTATSLLLDGFCVEVSRVFDAAISKQ